MCCRSCARSRGSSVSEAPPNAQRRFDRPIKENQPEKRRRKGEKSAGKEESSDKVETSGKEAPVKVAASAESAAKAQPEQATLDLAPQPKGGHRAAGEIRLRAAGKVDAPQAAVDTVAPAKDASADSASTGDGDESGREGGQRAAAPRRGRDQARSGGENAERAVTTKRTPPRRWRPRPR